MPKFTLSQTYLYGGKHYGPGEVDIADAEVAKALQERDASILAARQPRVVAPEPKDGGERARRATTRRA